MQLLLLVVEIRQNWFSSTHSKIDFHFSFETTHAQRIRRSKLPISSNSIRQKRFLNHSLPKNHAGSQWSIQRFLTSMLIMACLTLRYMSVQSYLAKLEPDFILKWYLPDRKSIYYKSVTKYKIRLTKDVNRDSIVLSILENLATTPTIQNESFE